MKRYTGNQDTDAVRNIACPRCQQPRGSGCRNQSGGEAATHQGRKQALRNYMGAIQWSKVYAQTYAARRAAEEGRQ